MSAATEIPTIPRRPFGSTGLLVTPLGIGSTGNVGVYRLLLDAGVNLVDTAQCYGEHESFLGESISYRRHEFILVSKCGHHDVLPDGSMRSRKISLLDVDRALARLKTDHLDVMLLHSYDRDLLQQGEAVAVLAEAKRAGKIRFAGYSGDNETAALAGLMPDIQVIEMSISVADQRNIDVALPSCRERGIGVIAKRPIANAAWRYLSRPPIEYAELKLKSYVERLALMGVSPLDCGIDDSAAGWSEMALRFNVGVEGLHTSIVATGSEAHARENLAAIAKGPLPAQTIAKIHDTFRRAASAGAGTWPAEN